MSPETQARPDEADVLARARNGEGEACDALVRMHQQQVFAVAMRMLGDRDEAVDVAQDAFVRAFQRLGTFRGEARLSTWLVSITMNLCRNRRRWWARRRRIIVASVDDTPPGDDGERSSAEQRVADPGPTPAVQAQRREQQQQIHQALQRLDAPERAIIILRDLEGCAYEDIAQILGCRLGTVKSRLSRARLALRGLLDGQV